MGSAIIKHPVPDLVKPVICNFWRSGTLTLRAERQSARMSKITNDGLTRSGTGCFIAVHIWQQWASKDYEFITNYLNETDRLMTRMYLSTHRRSVSESMISVIVWERGGHRRWSSLMRTIMFRWPWEYCSMTSRTSYGLRACYTQVQNVRFALE